MAIPTNQLKLVLSAIQGNEATSEKPWTPPPPPDSKKPVARPANSRTITPGEVIEIPDGFLGMPGETIEVTPDMLQDPEVAAGLMAAKAYATDPQVRSEIDALTEGMGPDDDAEDGDEGLTLAGQRQAIQRRDVVLADQEDQLLAQRVATDNARLAADTPDRVEIALRAAADALMAFGGNPGSNAAVQAVRRGQGKRRQAIDLKREFQALLLQRARRITKQEMREIEEKVKTREGLIEIVATVENHPVLALKTEGAPNLTGQQQELKRQVGELSAYRQANPDATDLKKRYAMMLAKQQGQLEVYRLTMSDVGSLQPHIEDIYRRGQGNDRSKADGIINDTATTFQQKRNRLSTIQGDIDKRKKSVDDEEDIVEARAIAKEQRQAASAALDAVEGLADVLELQSSRKVSIENGIPPMDIKQGFTRKFNDAVDAAEAADTPISRERQNYLRNRFNNAILKYNTEYQAAQEAAEE